MWTSLSLENQDGDFGLSTRHQARRAFVNLYLEVRWPQPVPTGLQTQSRSFAGATVMPWHDMAGGLRQLGSGNLHTGGK